MINKIVILGGGSAGFIAALAIKTRLPGVDVTVIRSKEIGIIGVGEGSTTALTRFLHNYLGVNPRKFYEQAAPLWKLGLKFIWGPRPCFYYSFGPGLDSRVEGLRRRIAYYCDQDMNDAEIYSAMMHQDRCFLRGPQGAMQMHPAFAYHVENEKFVGFLESYAQAVGVKIADDTVDRVLQNDEGVAGLVMKSGATHTGDLYVDCSGFMSLLLGKTLGEPFESYKASLYNDRAVVGGWDRPTSEPIHPYTTCETMNSGWCWQIEHEHRVVRGYVYSSSFISDEEAERELREKNPRIGATRVIRFVSGAYRRNWVKNVVAIGNASGFVEPLEASALAVIATQARTLVGVLIDSDRQPTPSHAAYYSDFNRRIWTGIRDFLSIHYRFNTRLDTPYWRECREKTDIGGAQPFIDFYRENGPTGYWGQLQMEPFDQFGASGYIALLVGMQVPHHASAQVANEAAEWRKVTAENRASAAGALDVRDALATIRSSKWVWPQHMLNREQA